MVPNHVPLRAQEEACRTLPITLHTFILLVREAGVIDNSFKYSDLMDLFDSASKELEANKFESSSNKRLTFTQFEAVVSPRLDAVAMAAQSADPA